MLKKVFYELKKLHKQIFFMLYYIHTRGIFHGTIFLAGRE